MFGQRLGRQVAEAPYGAHPTSCYPGYAYDRPYLAGYVEAAQRGGDRLAAWIDRWIAGAPTEEAHRKLVGEERLAALGRWTESFEAWTELFR